MEKGGVAHGEVIRLGSVEGMNSGIPIFEAVYPIRHRLLATVNSI